MRALEPVFNAFGVLRASKLRSALTALGVGIGVLAVVLLMALGDGTQRYVGNSFASLGGNLLQARPGKRDTASAAALPAAGVGHPLASEDVQALARHLFEADGVSGLVEGTATVRYGGRRRDVTVLGVGSHFTDMHRMQLAAGRAFSAGEDRSRRKVAIIGQTVRDELFGEVNPLGRSIRINDVDVRITGLLQYKGAVLGNDLNDLVLIPTATASDLFDLEHLSAIEVRPRSGSDVERVRESMQGILRRRHANVVDFTITSQEEMLATVHKTMSGLSLVLAAIASIGLIVGGVGIANITLASVHERTHEIGLRRALGASQRDITVQFVLESALLSLLGGCAGLAAAAGIAAIVRLAAPSFPVTVSPALAAVGLGFSALVGVLAGTGPALRAARMDPIRALRQD